MSRPSPDRASLLACARRLAEELHGVEPPEAELSERIDYVLWGRKQGWASLADRLITEVELRDLLLAHLDYECWDRSGRSWDQLDPVARAAIVEAFDLALYGRVARERP